MTTLEERLKAALEQNVETIRTTTAVRRLDDKMIIDLLRAAGEEVPDDADVAFLVPGGGDWSNTMADVDKHHPIYIKYKVVENE